MASPALRTPVSMRSLRRLVVASLATLAAASCAPGMQPGGSSDDELALESLAPDALHWVTPLADDAIHAGDPVEVTVYSQRADVGVVHFVVDGEEAGACDPNDPAQDCFDEDHWAWTVVFDASGPHHVSAWFADATGATVQIDRDVTAQSADTTDLSTDPEGDPDAPDPVPADMQLAEGSGQIEQGIDAANGFTDPNEPMGPDACHRPGASASACTATAEPACQSWSVQGARVVLPAPARLDGSTAEIDRCMQDFGISIRRYADLRYVSRASIAAWLAATGNCDPCIHWNRGLLTGARCVATARAMGTHVDARTCVARMDADGHDFAIQLAAEYLRRTVHLHHHDPVLEAAYLHHGAHRQLGDVNNWCVGSGVSSGAFITHYVAAYNAYRTWVGEARTDPRGADTHLCIGYSGWGDPGVFTQDHYADIFTRTSGLTNASLCHAYPRFDVATLDPGHADRQYFDTWHRAAVANHCEISVALKADNQQYTPGGTTPCSRACAPHEVCASNGRCEAHHIPSAEAYERAFQRFRHEYPDIHVFSTWNEPNNNAGKETALEPETAGEFYLRARRNCRPLQGCYVTAGDMASWYVVDPMSHAVTVDWMGGVAMQCNAHDPDALCDHGSWLDRFKYTIDRDSARFGLGAHFRPEYFGFHPWHDTLAYGLSHAHCDSAGNCMTRAMLENLGGSWSGAQLWATEAGFTHTPVAGQPADFSQACDAAFAMRMFALSPRIARFYLFDAEAVTGSGHADTIGVLRDRVGSFSSACW